MTGLEASSLEPQGPVASAAADLWWLMLWLGTAVFIVVIGLLVVGLTRRQLSPEGEDSPTSERWLRGGVVITIALLAIVFGATLVAMRQVQAEPPPGALEIEIVGHQWWWEVHYPAGGATTANELHLPVGRPVALRLTSADVIHSFWVPALAGKIDLLPDGTNTLVLQADEPGEHKSTCAEFCGLQHYQMGLRVVAEPAGAFADWIESQREPALEPDGATAGRGRDLFMGSDCATCHTVRGTPADGDVGPDLTHLASRQELGAGALPNTPMDLASWVANPHTVKEGVDMPAAGLSQEEIDAIVAYLGTLE